MQTSATLHSRPPLLAMQAGTSRGAAKVPLHAPLRTPTGRRPLKTACIATPSAPGKGAARAPPPESPGAQPPAAAGAAISTSACLRFFNWSWRLVSCLSALTCRAFPKRLAHVGETCACGLPSARTRLCNCAPSPCRLLCSAATGGCAPRGWPHLQVSDKSQRNHMHSVALLVRFARQISANLAPCQAPARLLSIRSVHQPIGASPSPPRLPSSAPHPMQLTAAGHQRGRAHATRQLAGHGGAVRGRARHRPPRGLDLRVHELRGEASKACSKRRFARWDAGLEGKACASCAEPGL